MAKTYLEGDNMLRLIVEGSKEKVRSFLKDFVSLPQYEVKSVSSNDDLDSFICYFEYYPLVEIDRPISITFETKDGTDLSFVLLQGSVIRKGDKVSISGQASSCLLE